MSENKNEIKINIEKNDEIGKIEIKPKINPDRDVNIGLDLLANTEKHIPVVKSPRIEVKIPNASIISKPGPTLVVEKNDNILSPHKVWSDVNSNINLSKNHIQRIETIESNQPIINRIEIDIDPELISGPNNSSSNFQTISTQRPESPIIVPISIPSPILKEPIPIVTPILKEPEIKVNTPKTPKNYNQEPSIKEIYFKKVDLLQKMNKIKRMGYVIPELSTSDEYETIKIEYDKIKKMRESENSIKFSRKMLLAIITAIEFLNNKFDPFDLELNGWSESVNENVEDYDDIFEALAEKYKSSSNMAPELKLLLMLGGSGFMFHLSNSMFKKMQNPDNMLGGMMGNLMSGLASGQQQAPVSSRPQNSNSNPMNSMMEMMGGLGSERVVNTNNTSNTSNTSNSNRREMSGPSGVDDILQHLQQRTTSTKNDKSISSRSRKNKNKGVSLNL